MLQRPTLLCRDLHMFFNAQLAHWHFGAANRTSDSTESTEVTLGW